ncbi:MAG: sigma-E factor negative regulatory protein [Sterolibacterium sp.]
MKPDISALLDDELEPGAASRTIDALRCEKELQEAWNVYHLIGDTLRRSPGYSHDLSAKVMARLAEEPILLAPAAKPKRTPLRFALPLAAAIMGMAAVGWVALSLNAPLPLELAAKPRSSNQPVVQLTEQSSSGALKEYLVAHQVHSPSGGIQGVATYVRSVSEIRQGGQP